MCNCEVSQVYGGDCEHTAPELMSGYVEPVAEVAPKLATIATGTDSRGRLDAELDAEPARCGHCGQPAARLDTDATGVPACFACYVPDITADRYRGGTEDFLVAAPNVKRVGP
jgi:hypothetical protein